MESHIRGNLGEELDLQERQGASVGDGREEGVGHHRILPMPQQAHWPASYQKALLPSASPLPSPSRMHETWGCLPSQREGWPQHLPEAYHHRSFPLPWPACPLEGLHPRGAAPSTASSQKKACSPEKLEQARPGHEKSASIIRQSFQVGLPWGRAFWVLSGPASCSSLWGGAAVPWNSCPALPAPCKSPTVQKHQSKLCLGK